MSLYFRKKLANGGDIGIWNTSETDKELQQLWNPTAEEMELVCAITHTARKREIMAVRILLNQMIGNKSQNTTIEYDSYGKPRLQNLATHITITHSKHMIGLMLHPHVQPGLDIELIDNRIFRMAPKFLSHSEQVHLQGKDALQKLHLVWAAKEVVYKIHGKKGVDFKSQLKVHNFELGAEDETHQLEIDFIFGGNTSRFELAYINKPEMVTVFGTEAQATKI